MNAYLTTNIDATTRVNEVQDAQLIALHLDKYLPSNFKVVSESGYGMYLHIKTDCGKNIHIRIKDHTADWNNTFYDFYQFAKETNKGFDYIISFVSTFETNVSSFAKTRKESIESCMRTLKDKIWEDEYLQDNDFQCEVECFELVFNYNIEDIIWCIEQIIENTGKFIGIADVAIPDIKLKYEYDNI